MIKQTLAAVVGAVAVAMALGAPTFAEAQTRNPTAPNRAIDTPQALRGERDRAQNEDLNRRTNRRASVPDRGQSMTQAQTALSAAGSTCQVTDVRYVGEASGDANARLFEADCAAGPGYMVQTTTPPQTFNCIALAAAAERDRAADPAAVVAVCELTGNTDIVGAIREIATQAGVPCTIDEAVLGGQNPDGKLVYEVGCAQADGYWVEGDGPTATITPCMQVILQNGACRFTTMAEQAAGVNAWLAGSDISDCNVQEARLMGQNANGRFYEVKCAAPDTGYILRTDMASVLQQSYACAVAQRIAGGCRLTTVPEAPAA